MIYHSSLSINTRFLIGLAFVFIINNISINNVNCEIILKKRWAHINLTVTNVQNSADSKYLYLSDSAVYGFNSPSRPITARLISVNCLNNPNNLTAGINTRGCSKYVNSNLPEHFVALVNRGDCPFEKKIAIAVENRAIAIIIHNIDQDVFTMLIKSKKITFKFTYFKF
jgi:hypothetical protein